MPASRIVHVGDYVTTIRQSGRVVRGRVMAIELGEARICDGERMIWLIRLIFPYYGKCDLCNNDAVFDGLCGQCLEAEYELRS